MDGLTPTNSYAGDVLGAKVARMATMAERIELAVVQAEDRLAKVKRAKEILAAHPDLEELLNIMQSSYF